MKNVLKNSHAVTYQNLFLHNAADIREGVGGSTMNVSLWFCLFLLLLVLTEVRGERL